MGAVSHVMRAISAHISSGGRVPSIRIVSPAGSASSYRRLRATSRSTGNCSGLRE